MTLMDQRTTGRVPRWLAVASGVLIAAVAWSPQGAMAADRRPELVRDLDPRGMSSDPNDFVVVNGTLFFTATDEDHGLELWKSDGTAAGTELVKDLVPGRIGSYPHHLVAVGPLLFFATSGARHSRLWTSDGTAAGTRLVRRLHRLASSYSNSVAMDGILYFQGFDEEHGSELWRSDGTRAGTWLVRDVTPGHLGGDSQLLVVGGKLFFATNGQLWKSDGTSSGTKRLAKVRAEELTAVGERLFFRGDTDPTGRELWTSDGTREGTQMVVDIVPGVEDGSPGSLAALGDMLLFSTSTIDAEGKRSWDLWTSDGTVATTAPIRHIEGGWGMAEPTAMGQALFFSAGDTAHGQELWRSDGTGAGTQLVRDIGPGDVGGGPSNLTVAGGRLFFFAWDGVHGSEPWVSNGVAGGTHLVRDIWPAAGGSFSDFDGRSSSASVAGSLMFVAQDPVRGGELWRSDGTRAGTRRVRDIHPGGVSPLIDEPTALRGSLFFGTALDGTYGNQLWRTDGTSEGTEELWFGVNGIVGKGPTALTPVGDRMFFFFKDFDALRLLVTNETRHGSRQIWWAYDSTTCHQGVGLRGMLYAGCEDGGLLRSDGTHTGTDYLVQFPAIHRYTFDVRDVIKVDDTLFFFVDKLLHRNSGTELIGSARLWRSDGTRHGSHEIARVDVGSVRPSRPADRLIAVGQTLYFAAEDPAHGGELWMSDGTEPGTRRLIDIRSGPSGSRPTHLAEAQDVLFFSANDGVRGRELWASDGTREGTRQLRDINPGEEGSNPSLVVEVGGRSFFTADDGKHGRELWATDGTARGTRLVRDIADGHIGSSPTALTEVAGELFFAATDGAGGEVWRSDGTRPGTRRVADLRPGVRGSRPTDLVDVDGALLFVADDGVHGRELWKFAP